MTARSDPRWRLALPMYNLTTDLGRAWERLLGAVVDGLRQRGWRDAMDIVAAPPDLIGFWRSPDLLLSQSCGYPLATVLGDAVRVIAAAEFDWPGCSGVQYCSAIVVAEGAADSLEALRGKVAAINERHSHSGMNALRHTIAPMAQGGRFFERVIVAGSHLASLCALQRGQADVAAVDCVTLALAQQEAPGALAGLRVLLHTAPAPGLPLVASRRLDDSQAADLLAVLQDLPMAVPSLMARLGLRRFSSIGLGDYQPILDMQRSAQSHAYPLLA